MDQGIVVNEPEFIYSINVGGPEKKIHQMLKSILDGDALAVVMEEQVTIEGERKSIKRMHYGRAAHEFDDDPIIGKNRLIRLKAGTLDYEKEIFICSIDESDVMINNLVVCVMRMIPNEVCWV
jgi:hypothetical protein